VRNEIVKIAITGPESTGKSTLTKQLAKYYQTVCTSEYARKYLDQLNRPYERDDLLQILHGQIAEENAQAKHARQVLFCDTDPIVLKIWSIYKYGSAHSSINSEATNRDYGLYLLMDIDLPWKYDSQREHPNKRQYFYDLFEQELKARQANYRIVYGHGDQRLRSAIEIVDDFFNPKV